jgi:hypothetical protein
MQRDAPSIPLAASLTPWVSAMILLLNLGECFFTDYRVDVIALARMPPAMD